MNAVSTKEASGSAASANAAGNAIDAISRPSPSLVNALLKEKQWQHIEKMSRKLQQYHHTCYFETINCRFDAIGHQDKATAYTDWFDTDFYQKYLCALCKLSPEAEQLDQ
jgi:hypothetical protein